MFYGTPDVVKALPIVQGAHWVQPVPPSYSPQALYDLLAAARETNSLLKSVLETLSAASQHAPSADNREVAERLDWLERQVAELKERL